MFTVNLTRYGLRQQFPLTQFTKEYPDCMITLALQSGDPEIPIEHPHVTPTVIILLAAILRDQDILPLDSSYLRGLNYLGIDLPRFVFHPKYHRFRILHPTCTLANLEEQYSVILPYAINHHLPDLVTYILAHTQVEDQMNRDIIQDILVHTPYSEDIEKGLIQILRYAPSVGRLIMPADVARRGYIHVLDLLTPHVSFDGIMKHAISGIYLNPHNLHHQIQVIRHISERYNGHLTHMDRMYYNFVMDHCEKLDLCRLIPMNESWILVLPSMLYLTALTDRPAYYEYFIRKAERIDGCQHTPDIFLESIVHHLDLISPSMKQTIINRLTLAQQLQYGELLL